jgi:hypothetical protein
MPSRGERESARSDSQRCCQVRESAEVRTTSRRSTRVRMLSSTRESGRERRQQVRRLRRRRMWGVGAGLHAPQNSLSGLSLSLRETETRQPAAHCLRGLGCPHSSYSKFILYKEYSCLVIRILEFSINFPAPVIPYITYSIPTTSHGTHMSYTALLFTPHPTLSPAPSSLLSLPHPTYPSVAASLPASYSASHGGPAAEEVARRGGWPARGSRRRRRQHRSSHPKAGDDGAPSPLIDAAAQSSHPKVGGSSRGGPRPQVQRAAAGGLYLPDPPPLWRRRPLLQLRRRWLGRCVQGRRPPLSLYRVGARGGGGSSGRSSDDGEPRRWGGEARVLGEPLSPSIRPAAVQCPCFTLPPPLRRQGSWASRGVRRPHATSSGGVAWYVRWEWGSTADTGPFRRS